MKYDLEKRIFLLEKYIKFEQISSVQHAYRSKFKNKPAPGHNTIMGIVSAFKTAGSVLPKLKLTGWTPLKTLYNHHCTYVNILGDKWVQRAMVTKWAEWRNVISSLTSVKKKYFSSSLLFLSLLTVY